MAERSFPGSFRIPWIISGVILLSAIYIAINAFTVGGDAFVLNLNNFITVPLTIVVPLLAILIASRIERGDRNYTIWWGLAAGWTAWTIAELWWVIASAISQEVPYPSGADFIWIIGYIPMYIGLWQRIQSLPKITGAGRFAMLWATALVAIALITAFITLPIIQEFDASLIVESTLNLLYPLADLALTLLVLRIFFSYQQGVYGRAWALLSGGFLLMALSDFVFCYASNIDLYYPDGQANLISTLASDVPYNLSFVPWIIGLWMVHRAHNNLKDSIEANPTIRLVANTHVYLSIDKSGRVLNASWNYAQAFGPAFGQGGVAGHKLEEALGISAAEADALTSVIKLKGVLKEQAYTSDMGGERRRILVSGVDVEDEMGYSEGVLVLVRTLCEDYATDQVVSSYNREMIDALLDRTGARQNEAAEIVQLLSSYYQAVLQAFYNRLVVEGGVDMARAFVSELCSTSEANGWPMRSQAGALVDPGELTPETARQVLPGLFQAGRRFFSRVVNESTAEQITWAVRSRFGEAAQRNIAYWEAQGQAIGREP